MLAPKLHELHAEILLMVRPRPRREHASASGLSGHVLQQVRQSLEAGRMGKGAGEREEGDWGRGSVTVFAGRRGVRFQRRTSAN